MLKNHDHELLYELYLFCHKLLSFIKSLGLVERGEIEDLVGFGKLLLLVLSIIVVGMLLGGFL